MFTLSSTEIPSCPVFPVRDLDAQRVYRLCDLTAALLIRPCVANSVAGTVSSADKHYLVIESVRPDTIHAKSSPIPVPADGAGGSPIG
jgi:hypothetical protein